MKLRPLGDAPEWVDVGDDLQLPARCQVELTDHNVPGVAAIDLTLAVEGDRLVCEEIRFVAEPRGRLVRRPGDQRPYQGVTTESLRDIPMAALLAEVAFALARTHVESDAWLLEPERFPIPLSAASPEHQDRARAKFGPRRRRRIDRKHLEEIADTYSAEEFAPTQAVADKYFVDHSTAARWVARARAEGLLTDTTQGRPSRASKSATRDRTSKGAK